MYLKLLNDQEKKAFLELACDLSAVDGNFEQAESLMISEYCNEMDISFEECSTNGDITVLLNKLNETLDGKSKKIILFELLGLALCDNMFDNKERDFIYSIAENFGIDKNIVNAFEDVISKYIKIQHDIDDMILG